MEHRATAALLMAALAAATAALVAALPLLAGGARTAYVLAVALAIAGLLLAAWRWGRPVAAARPRIDPLTGLADRAAFLEEAAARLAGGGPQALLVLDLDRFKEVNDILGPEAGDRLLALVAERVRSAAPAGSLVGRLGGDEFAILAQAGPAEAEALARCVHERVSRPCEFEGVPLDVGGGVGVACAPDHGTTPARLLQRAELAMYIAKGGHHGVTVYDPARDQRTVRRLALMGEVRRAVETGEFVLLYQPKVALRTGRVTGVEALLRWRHPRRGLLEPRHFLPHIERTGLMRRLSDQVLQAALAQAWAWAAEGLRLPVAVNLSARTLQDPALPRHVAEALEAAGVEAALLEIEVTESAIMTDPRLARQVVCALHEMGVRLAIDDFGTGYSSLGYLKRLPVHTLKIDAGFVAHMTVDESDAIIVRSTIELAHNLGLQVVAEGVGGRETWDVLRGMGCDQGQGFGIVPPLPPEEAAARVRAGTVVPVAGPQSAGGGGV
ncbi:putative bifunctional diguanylate cyclase/phosphodiesterase [Inmirania thermothiophila]|uniref:Diguanylate cyclase (GGDEF)-like protein n=1 Tax=Inmirania thermothiophila TaxID=1750597 RepID=A0A3N1XQV4_9GAMM|nr:bifunctional diguanylate cyclase/phosphodiesterase [Inmirania thermothiophila]ROR29063.1 diguanylate cyclase (GGDEF)-like protein [Inmirania thermothiophila]